MTSRGVNRFSKSGTVGIVGLALLLRSGLALAGPPNPMQSDSLDNTAGGTDALIITTGSVNTGFGSHVLYHNTTGAYNTASGGYALYRQHHGWLQYSEWHGRAR